MRAFGSPRAKAREPPRDEEFAAGFVVVRGERSNGVQQRRATQHRKPPRAQIAAQSAKTDAPGCADRQHEAGEQWTRRACSRLPIQPETTFVAASLPLGPSSRAWEQKTACVGRVVVKAIAGRTRSVVNHERLGLRRASPPRPPHMSQPGPTYPATRTRPGGYLSVESGPTTVHRGRSRNEHRGRKDTCRLSPLRARTRTRASRSNSLPFGDGESSQRRAPPAGDPGSEPPCGARGGRGMDYVLPEWPLRRFSHVRVVVFGRQCGAASRA